MINDGPVSGSYADLKNANRMITQSYIAWGLGGTPITYPSLASAPASMRREVERDILDAEKYADELVAANIETIKALADDLMGITPKNGKRTMEADVFKAFCGLHTLVDPRAPPPEKKPK